jgi:hypothetical protein
MSFTLLQLKTECLTNPLLLIDPGTGRTLQDLYNSGADGTCVDILNRIIVGNTVRRIDIKPLEILGTIDDRDWAANLTAIQSAWFQSLTSDDVVSFQNPDGTDNNVLGNLKRMLQNPGPQLSRAAIIALSTRDGTRAEKLWGTGTVISADNVSDSHRA